mgnify:FL=1
MFGILKSNKGMALPLVLVVMVVLMVFSTAILGMGATDTLMSAHDSNKSQAYYYAHSGAEAVASYIVENPDGLSESERKALVDRMIAAGASNPFTLSSSDSGVIVVDMSRSGNTISIRSTATYQGIQESVTLNILETVIGGEPFNKAIYSRGNITLTGGASVEGDIAGLSRITLDGGSRVTGTIYIHPDADESSVSSPPWISTTIENLTEIFDYDTFPFPEFPAYPSGLPSDNTTLNVNSGTRRIESDVYYRGGIAVTNGELQIVRMNTDRIIRTRYLRVSGSGRVSDIRSGNRTLQIYVDEDLELSSNTTLTFDLGDGDIILRVRRLLLNQGHIQVNHNGTGKLYIFVDDVFHIAGSSSINHSWSASAAQLEGWAKKVLVYYAGTIDKDGNDIRNPGNSYYLKFPNAVKVVATLHVKEAKIHITNGTGVAGNIISGGSKLQFDGGTNSDVKVVYAPNAEIEVRGGALVTGIVVCDSFSMSGGARVKYQPIGEEEMEYFKDVAGKTVYTYGHWE